MSIWKNKNFVILFSGQLVSVIGDNLYGIALLWYVLDLTHSKSALAITGFATTLPPIVGAFVGVWVDRWRKKYTMMVSDALRASLLLTLFAISSFSIPSFPLIVGLVVLVEVVGTFFSPAFSSLLPQLVAKDDFAMASGANMSGSAFASLGGMLGGGALMTFLGAPRLFLGDAMSFVLSAVSLLFVREPELKRTRVHDTSLVKEWKEGMRAILKSRYLLQTGLTSAVNNFSLAAFGIVITPWVKDALHGSALLLGAIYSLLFVGMILGGLSAGTIAQRFRYRIIVCVTLVGLGLGVSLTGAWANEYWDMAWVLLLTGIGPVIGGLSYLMPFSKQAFSEIDEKRGTGEVGSNTAF